MTQRLRTSIITIYCAVVLFGVAWLPINRVGDPRSEWVAAVRLHPALGMALVVLNTAALSAFLATLVGGLSILWSVYLQAIRARQRAILRPLLVTPLAVAVLIGYILLASHWWAATRAPSSPLLTPLAVALQLGFFILLLVTIAGSAVATALVMTRGVVDARVLRFALVPATAATLALVVGVAATLTLFVLLYTAVPQLLSLTALWPFLMADVLFMTAAFWLSIAAIWRGLGALRGGGWVA